MSTLRLFLVKPNNSLVFIVLFFFVSLICYNVGKLIDKSVEHSEVLFDKQVEFNNIVPNENNFREITLTNISNNDVVIVGAKSCCGAAVPMELPCTIGKNSKIKIPVTFKYTNQTQTIFSGHITLYTISPGSKATSPITIEFRCFVL